MAGELPPPGVPSRHALVCRTCHAPFPVKLLQISDLRFASCQPKNSVDAKRCRPSTKAIKHPQATNSAAPSKDCCREAEDKQMESGF
jgi:hypothetical protein